MSPPYIPVNPAQLAAWLSDDALLILDVRPSAAYNSARLPRALSLAVPTTLLKRPLFSLDRLATMLSNADARSRFSDRSSSSRILVYDADSNFLSDSSIINALLRKFRAEGFTRDLAWIKGGFQAVVREAHSLIDFHTLDTCMDDDEENDATRLPAHSVLRPNRLPSAAFTLSSTTLSSYGLPLSQKNKPPALPTVHAGVELPQNRLAFNPFFDVVRQNIELSQGITERIPLYLPRRVRHRIHDLPFRWLQDIAQKAASRPRLDDLFVQSDCEEEKDMDPVAATHGAEMLAMQFYKIELAEQQRLMSVLEHHTRTNGKDDPSINETFPFSITAGIEKGEKNRYRHIWPFEHTRVRLHHKQDSGDDYVNASYVQPLGTNRRYIATQGPLPATFSDFWTLCWEQNVHVIVMLTREVEGSMVKCGAYWNDSVYGPLRLRLISTTGPLPTDDEKANPGYFSLQPSVISSSEAMSPSGADRHVRPPTTIKRVFELTHAGYPHVKPRRVTHFQYLEWPDMTVPDDPRDVLQLIEEVDKVVEETRGTGEAGTVVDEADGTMSYVELDERTGIATHALGKSSPILLHCSAGVGRTGGFIAVDAVLDAVRRELKKPSPRMQQQPNRHARHGSDLKSATGNAVMSESGGSSSSSMLRAGTDSSSSDDSFEFERNARICGRYQSTNFGAPSPATPVRTDSMVPVSAPYYTTNSTPQPSGACTSQMQSPLPSLKANRHGRAREVESSSLSHQSVVSSDEGEFASRSRSSSADESELKVPTSRLHKNHFTIPSRPNSPPSSSPPICNDASASATFLKEPRRLRGDITPIELSTLEDPIWEVVQDMREQRMSLCQSLRQYVFVHAAIIEGALSIVDEERQRRRPETDGFSVSPISQKINCKSGHDPIQKANQCRPIGLSVRANGLAAAILAGKRVASPTELPKENKQGQVLLSKRPSLQRAKSP